MMKEKFVGIYPDHILNIDQTLIPMIHDTKTIHICAPAIDTKSVTLAATVTANRKMLPPMLIFKGATNGRIVK